MIFKPAFDFLSLESIFLSDTKVAFCLFCSANDRSDQVHPLLGNLRLMPAKSQYFFLTFFIMDYSHKFSYGNKRGT